MWHPTYQHLGYIIICAESFDAQQSGETNPCLTTFFWWWFLFFCIIPVGNVFLKGVETTNKLNVEPKVGFTSENTPVKHLTRWEYLMGTGSYQKHMNESGWEDKSLKNSLRSKKPDTNNLGSWRRPKDSLFIGKFFHVQAVCQGWIFGMLAGIVLNASGLQWPPDLPTRWW